MAITRGQKSTLAAVGSATTLAVTWPVNPAAGNTILLFVQCANVPTSVADNGTTPSTFILDKSTAGGRGAYVYRASNVTMPSAGAYTVTITTSTLTTIGGAGIEYAGVAAGAPTAVNSSSGTGTSAATGSAAPAGAGGLVFGGFSDASGLNPETITFTGPSPQAEQFRETNGASFWPWAVADALTGSAQNFTWTLGDSVAAGGVAAAYDAAGTGGGGGTNPSWDTGGSYTMVFDDEFAGTTLDASKWQPGWFSASGVTPGVNSGSPQNNSANVSVSGGTLNLLLTSSYGALVTTNPHNSGTATGFEQTYPAAIEARINIPGNTGGSFNWPAWWTDGQNWPSTGEIDIVEGLSGGTTSYHIHDAAFPGGIGGDATPPYTGWHTFGAMWTATQVKFYYDGVLVGTEPTDGFTGPHYLILVNTAPTTSPSPVPTTMQVDWVRVWTPGASGTAGTAAAAGAGAATAKAVQAAAGTAAGAGVVSASARQVTASAAGAGAVTAKAVQAAAGTAAGAGVVSASATSRVFPGAGANSLGVKIELLLGGAWTDITQYVRLRNPVQISGMGRADWTSALQAAALTLTLANDGRFTPKLAAGAYFPNIGRNVQLRVSVSATSLTGVPYSGFRFWGEVAEWPPHWSASARDVYADITANGIWRRMSQLQTTLGSAFTRYNSLTLTGASAPRAYWPMEDGVGSGQLVSYDSVAGTANAVQSFVTGQAGLSLAACTDFKGSDGIPQLNGASIIATVPAGGTPAVNCTRFLLSVPAAGDSAQGTTAGNIIEIDSAGTVAKFEVYLNPGPGTLLMQLRNSAGTLIAAGTTTTSVKGQPYLVSCELTPSGSNVAFALRIIRPGGAGITESVTGSVTGSVGVISAVKFSRANVLMDTAVGHLSVTYGAVPLMVPAAYALGGYAGELAMDRFTRICGEMGIAAETIGAASGTAAMGPQVDDTLTSVLQSVEDTDLGLLFESRTQFGLGYRSLTSMANQAAAATISYTTARIDPSLSTAFDDALTRNNVTVTNWTGYTQQAILTAGPMSILNPPSGIGNGYAYQRTVNAASDTQIAGIANWLLNVGSVDEIRFPVITIKMTRAENAGLFAAIPGLRPGDYVQITNPPSFLTASTVRQLAVGYTETISGDPKQWTFAFNAVPESPYETGFSAGTVQTAQLPGSGAVTSTAPGAGGLGGIIANGSITPGMLSGGITVKTLGGNRITIAASAPANPDTGDIWIASATGLISQWSGSAWTPFKFDASQTIQAGTIVGSNIAASTLTSSLIAAGQVYAGFVDSTTVEAAQYIATSAQGEFLAYDVSSPATGHLVNSIAGAAGTDSVSNPYPIGLYSQQLTLASQSGAPTGVSGSSVIYTSSGGRLRYLSASGNDLVLDRSVLDLTNFSMGTQTIPHILSSTVNYLANEAIVGSEFEIEIDGTYTTPSGTSATFTFDLFVDGAALGAGSSITVGTVINQTGLTYAFTARWRATVNTAGAGGNVTVAVDGGVTRKGVNVGGATSQLGTLNNILSSAAFDTTANHSLAVYCNWSSTVGTGHSAIVYRTKKTRRN